MEEAENAVTASIALPFHDIGSKATRAIERTNQAKVMSRWLQALICLPIVPALRSINRDIGRVIRFLNSAESDHLREDELRRIAHAINQSYAKTQKLLSAYEQTDLKEFSVFRLPFSDMERNTCHLYSLAEGIYLSLNEDFQIAMAEAATEVESAIKGY